MKIVIVVRRTEPWNEIEHFPTYFKQRRPNDPVLRLFEQWDAELGVPYAKYRTEICSIARRNWERTGCEIVELKNVRPDMADIFLPTDDDDWFAPDIRDHLEDHPFLQWDNWLHCPTGTHKFNQHDGSNSYGVRNDIKRLRQHLNNHHSILGKNPFVINKALSIWVRHPGALSLLRMRGSITLWKRLYEGPLPEPIQWATQEHDELCGLCELPLP